MLKKKIKINNSLITLDEPYSYISEQFKKLRAKIIYGRNGETPRTILVTSAVQDEGKSTIAANLAISISQGLSEYVLLIDADLRSPSVHELFNIEIVKGLTDYLKYGEDISSLILKTDIDKLSIMSAGRAVDNPAELVASEKMAHLIQELRSRYNNRYIVIDSTPIIPTTEPTILANLADAVILVVKSDKTPRDLVKKAMDNIKLDKILGIVFNDVKETPVNKYKYYRYYYGENRE